MDVRQLETIIAVAEERSFTRAAGRLHVVQSAVSASVAAFEKEIGFRVFDRSSRGAEVTAAGSELLPVTRDAVAALRRVEEVAAGLHGELRGAVRLGVFAAPDLFGFAEVLAAFRGAHPLVSVSARTSPRGGMGLISELVDGGLDLSIVLMPLPAPPGIRLDGVIAGRYVLAVGQDHPLAARDLVRPRDLRGHEFVTHPPGFTARLLLDDWLATHRLRPEVRVEVGDQSLVASYAAAGFGVAIMGEYQLGLAPGLVALPVEGWDATWTVALARRSAGPRSAAVEALAERFRERLVAAAPGMLAWPVADQPARPRRG